MYGSPTEQENLRKEDERELKLFEKEFGNDLLFGDAHHRPSAVAYRLEDFKGKRMHRYPVTVSREHLYGGWKKTIWVTAHSLGDAANWVADRLAKSMGGDAYNLHVQAVGPRGGKSKAGYRYLGMMSLMGRRMG